MMCGLIVHFGKSSGGFSNTLTDLQQPTAHRNCGIFATYPAAELHLRLQLIEVVAFLRAGGTLAGAAPMISLFDQISRPEWA